MSEQEYRIEKCGGLTVYHPIKKQASREEHWLRVEDIIEFEHERIAREARRTAYYSQFFDMLDTA